MSVTSYQTSKGKVLWKALVKTRNRLGKQVYRVKKGITSEGKAKRIEFELKKELEDGFGKNSEWLWWEWHEECISRMRLTLKEGTVINYNGDLRHWLPHEWKEMKLVSITKNDVHQLIFEHMAEATPHSRKNVLKKMRRLFEMAVEEGIIARNPASGIRVKVPAPQKNVLNSNEAALLLKTAKECNHPFYPIWALALFTGMRSGEMYALRWKHIDLETGLISVSSQWTSKDGLHETKTNKIRVVPISCELKQLLIELKLKGGFTANLFKLVPDPEAGNKRRKKKEDNFCHDLVLPHPTEWRYGTQAQVLEDFCRAAGITQVKFHDLRATFITNLLSQGVPLVKVMAIVGHSKMSTTDEYVRLAGVNVAKSTEKLGYQLPAQETGKVVQLFQSK